jgi:hypothetical protein
MSNGPNANFIGPSSFAFEAHPNANAATTIEALIGPNIGPLDRICKRAIYYRPGQGTARHGAAGQSSEQLSPFDTIVLGSFTPPRHA